MTAVSGTYRDLVAWQKAMELVVNVYEQTRCLPPDERFTLVSQMRRCAVSVPSNIAEGWGRGNGPDFTRFLTIARGSMFELSTQIEICQSLDYPGDWAGLTTQTDEVGRILQGLIRSRQSSHN